MISDRSYLKWVITSKIKITANLTLLQHNNIRDWTNHRPELNNCAGLAHGS